MRVILIRLLRHLGRWVIDKDQIGPADQVDKRIEEFEAWASRQAGASGTLHLVEGRALDAIPVASDEAWGRLAASSGGEIHGDFHQNFDDLFIRIGIETVGVLFE